MSRAAGEVLRRWSEPQVVKGSVVNLGSVVDCEPNRERVSGLAERAEWRESVTESASEPWGRRGP